MRLDYEILENERAFKFTKEFAYQSQENEISSILRTVGNRESFDNTVNFIESKRASDINYLSNQISIAQNFSLPQPAQARALPLSRSGADFYNAGIGKFENLHEGTQINIINIENNRRVREEFEIFNAGVMAKVRGYIENLTNQKSLLESKSFI